MRVGIVGQGYVGLTGSVKLAEAGHEVIGVERDLQRLRALQAERVPFFEPGLQDLLAAMVRHGRLRFTVHLAQARAKRPFDAVLVAVGTPARPLGAVDLTQVDAALAEAAALDPLPDLIIVKSTVPPGTSRGIVRRHAQLRRRYVYNPEFLNQGTALTD